MSFAVNGGDLEPKPKLLFLRMESAMRRSSCSPATDRSTSDVNW